MARAQTTNGKTATADINDLTNQIEEIKADLAKLTSIMGDIGSANTTRAKEKVAEKIETAREASEAQLAEAKMQAQLLGAQANEFVARQPAMALGIAAGVGFLVGMIGARR